MKKGPSIAEGLFLLLSFFVRDPALFLPLFSGVVGDLKTAIRHGPT